MAKHKNNKTSEILINASRRYKAKQSTQDRITVFDLRDSFHEKGFPFIMLVLSLPLSFPIPVPPGVTSLFAIPILIFSFQLLIGYSSPWIPKWLGYRSIKRTTLAKILEKTGKVLMKIEKLTNPRLDIFNSFLGEKIYALAAIIFGISIAVPLPLTNFIPSLGIVFMSLGVLNKDGIITILGFIIGTIGILVTITVILLGQLFIEETLSWLF